MGQTVNLLVFTFGGSNPSSPTLIFYAEVAQLVEHNLAKVGVASSSLVFRSHQEALEILTLRLFSLFSVLLMEDRSSKSQC